LNKFESFDLYAPLKKALAEQNYETPTPIQAQTIPPAVDGKDILGCAQTGTGKTAAFALPILDYIGHERPELFPKSPTVLILAPTRELAIQIGDSFATYGRHVKFKQALVYGGVNQDRQVKALSRGVDVLIATPGRLMDLMEQGHIKIGQVQIFVLDEADRMMDMGFLPALRKIIAKLPEQRQSLFFSATMSDKARELSNRLLYQPVSVNVTPESPSVDRIEQRMLMLDRGNKFNMLKDILNGDDVEQTIVFTRTKRGANVIVRKLEQAKIGALAIHGNKSQNARQRALEAFRKGKISVLVATDVAARGIDIDGGSHVVNYDMPVEEESYVHRIGRTGRAGREGIAISLCTPEERSELRAIEKLIEMQFDLELPYGEVSPPQPKPKSGGRGGSRGRGGYGNSRSGGSGATGGGNRSVGKPNKKRRNNNANGRKAAPKSSSRAVSRQR
jgi:ATP-dependent RNA helicase RhlE